MITHCPNPIAVALSRATDRLVERIAAWIDPPPPLTVLTSSDRKRVAQYLYGEREWTMECIAEALRVSTKQVSRDLEGFDITSKPARPQGGRPKKSTHSGAPVRWVQ